MRSNEDSLNYPVKWTSGILKRRIYELTTDTSMIGNTQQDSYNFENSKYRQPAFKILSIKNKSSEGNKLTLENIKNKNVLNRATASSSTHKKGFRRCAAIDQLKFPNINEIFFSLIQADKVTENSPSPKDGSVVFWVRFNLMQKIIKISKKHLLNDETILLSMWLLDVYMIKFSDSIVDYKDDECIDELPPNILKTKAYALLNKIVYSVVFISAKYSEVLPPRFSDLMEETELDLDKFVKYESVILRSLDYKIMPQSYLSYIHMINCKVLNSAFWAQRIKNIVYLTVLSGHGRTLEPVYLVFSTAFMVITKEIQCSLYEFKKLCNEFDICEKRCIEGSSLLSKHLYKFINRVGSSTAEDIIKQTPINENIFYYM